MRFFAQPNKKIRACWHWINSNQARFPNRQLLKISANQNTDDVSDLYPASYTPAKMFAAILCLRRPR